MKHKILIAVDLSEQSGGILQQGLDFAHKMNGVLVICSIIPVYVDYLQSQMALVPTQWDEMYTAQKKEALAVLNAFKEKHPEIHMDLVVEVGNPKFDIIEKSKELHATYIVVGTHGRTGLSHTVMGSTAEYIIRHATVPVLVIPMDRKDH